MHYSFIFAVSILCLSLPHTTFSFFDNIQKHWQYGMRICGTLGRMKAEARRYAADTSLESSEAIPCLLDATTLANDPNFLSFQVGISTSAHQYGPDCVTHDGIDQPICDVARWSDKHNLKQPTPEHGYFLDITTNYKQYIDTAKKLGLTMFRFEVSWPLVQPDGPESYNSKALEIYHNMFNYMVQQGITPLVCFSHYHNPCWFLDRGCFTKKENIRNFATYCGTVYQYLMLNALKNEYTQQALKTITPRWATFNSPEAMGFKQFQTDDLPTPPHNPDKGKIQLALETFQNICEAHVEAAEAIRLNHQLVNHSYPDAPSPSIGILKNVHQLEPAPYVAQQSLLQGLKTHACCIVGNMLQNDGIFNFLDHGSFEITIPGLCDIKANPEYTPERVKNSYNWIGVNCYSRGYMDGAQKVPPKLEHQTANKTYANDPQSILHALTQIKTRLGDVPIIVTETGIACADDSTESIATTNNFYAQCMYMILQAIKKGSNIIGITPWSLSDNFEWIKPGDPDGQADNPKAARRLYGLCAVDTTGKIALKGQGSWLVQFAQAVQNRKVKMQAPPATTPTIG